MFKSFIEKFLCMHDYVKTDMSTTITRTNTYWNGSTHKTIKDINILKCKKCGKIKRIIVKF